MTGFKLSLLLGLAAIAIGCGGDDDAGPPQIQPHLNPVAFGNFGPGMCNDNAACDGGEDCTSCEADCGACADCDDGVCAGTAHFDVILRNVGGGTLEISGMEVNGDSNCAIVGDPQFDQPLPIRLAEGAGTFLGFDYLPGGNNRSTAGTKDQIAIAITSNSNEFPVMEISVCSCILDHTPDPAPGAEDPCECNLDEVQDADCGS